MTFSHGRKARLYFAGLNLSSFLNSVDLEATVDTAETSVFTSDSKTYVPGLKDGRATVDGLFDGSAGAQDAKLRAALHGAGGDVFTYLPQGDGFGKTAWCWLADEIGYRIATPISDAARWSAEGQVSGGTEHGRVLHTLQAEAGALNGAFDDNTVASPNGGAGYLQVIGTGPVAAFTVTIEDSADNLSYLPVATFTPATDSTAERVAIAGTLRQYTRYTVSGTTGGLKFSVVVTRNN